MTWQEKHDELQNLFSEKFDTYEKFLTEHSLGIDELDEFLLAKSEFEKASNDFQTFIILFKEKQPIRNLKSNALTSTMKNLLLKAR